MVRRPIVNKTNTTPVLSFKTMIFNVPMGGTLDKPVVDEASLEIVPTILAAAIAEALVPAAHFAASERVLQRLRDRIGPEALSPTATAATPAPAPRAASFITLANSLGKTGADGKSGEGWIEMLPKAHAKLLYTDGQAESYVIRLEPGAWAPAHDHPADEECLVLEGTLWQGDIFLQAGDFHVARPGDRHGDLRTDTGALVFIRYGKPLAQYLQM